MSKKFVILTALLVFAAHAVIGATRPSTMLEFFIDMRVKSMPVVKADYKRTFDEAGNIRIEPFLEDFRFCVQNELNFQAASWEEGLKKCSQDYDEMMVNIVESVANGKLNKRYLALAGEKGDKAAAEKWVDDQISEKVAQDLLAERNKSAPQVTELMNKVIAIIKAEGPSAVKPAVAEVGPGMPVK